MGDMLPMVHPDDFVIGGWDISGMRMDKAMERAQVLDWDLQRQLGVYMKDIKPMPGIYCESAQVCTTASIVLNDRIVRNELMPRPRLYRGQPSRPSRQPPPRLRQAGSPRAPPVRHPRLQGHARPRQPRRPLDGQHGAIRRDHPRR